MNGIAKFYGMHVKVPKASAMMDVTVHVSGSQRPGEDPIVQVRIWDESDMEKLRQEKLPGAVRKAVLTLTMKQARELARELEKTFPEWREEKNP